VERLRIDRWLWCARFFKARNLAATQVTAGHVRVNGQRAKPAHEIKIGDALTIARGSDECEVVVAAIPGRRGPAREAASCYVETEASLERRRLRAERRAGAQRFDPPTAGRPDKRTRRLIRERQRGGIIP